MADQNPIEIDEHAMPSVNIDERAEADVVYYGARFRPFGKDWVKVGLRDYVPINILVDVISDMVPGTTLKTNWMSYKKDKLVDIMMKIYDKTDDAGRARIEKWVYAHRFRRKVQADYPFLRRLESFYLFLRDGKGGYKIYVPPDVATKVAAQLTLSGIDDIREVKSILRTCICKKGEDWQVFDSLFNMWFNTTLTSYTGGRTTISPPSTSSLYRAFEGDNDDAGVEAAVKELKKVITTVGTGIGAGGGGKSSSKVSDALKDLEQESGGESGESGESEPSQDESKPSEDDESKEGNKDKGKGKDKDKKGEDKDNGKKDKPSDEGKPPKEPTTEKEKEKERSIKTTKLLKDILKEHGGSLHIDELKKIAASREV